MRTIRQQLDDLEAEIKGIEILPDDVEAWRQIRVTKRFLLEVQYAMMLVLELDDDDDYYESIDRTALTANRRRAMKKAYESVLGWDADFLDN